jgi:uncharacterized protein (TIGR03437 family)
MDTSVTINGVVAPLLFVSGKQINAQIPYEVPPGDATVVVRSGGAKSAPFTVKIRHAAPGVFMNELGRAAALDDDGSANSENSPASGGSVISVFLTGVGPVTAPVEDGAAPSRGEIIAATLPVSATIGGEPAEVLFAGLAPLFPGTAQINRRVPATVSGDSPLVISIGGSVSNSVQLVVSTH